MNVLVVDDSRTIHAFVKSCFFGAAIKLETAENGVEAIEKLKSRSYNLILLDWEMPEMEGPETFDEMRNLKVDTPVIMMTTKNDVKDVERMIVAGVSEYVMKPFTKEILLAKIESVLGEF